MCACMMDDCRAGFALVVVHLPISDALWLLQYSDSAFGSLACNVCDLAAQVQVQSPGAAGRTEACSVFATGMMIKESRERGCRMIMRR